MLGWPSDVKILNDGMYSVIRNHTGLRLSRITPYVDLYTLVQLLVILTYFQGHRNLENPNPVVELLKNCTLMLSYITG